MARKTTKAVKRRLVITIPITMSIILFAVITSIIEINKIKTYRDEEERLSNELQLLKEDAESLNIEITKLSSPDYIARYAREKYLYSKDGEKVVILDVEEDIEENIEEDQKLDYLTYASIIVGSILFLVIVLIIIIKSRKKKK